MSFRQPLQAPVWKGRPRLDEAATVPFRSLKLGGDVDGTEDLQKFQSVLTMIGLLKSITFAKPGGGSKTFLVTPFDLGDEWGETASDCYYGLKTQSAVEDLQTLFQGEVIFGPQGQQLLVDGKAGMQTLDLMDYILQLPGQGDANGSQDDSQDDSQ